MGTKIDERNFAAFQCPKCGNVMVTDTDVRYWISTTDEEVLARSWNNCLFCTNQINALAIRDGRLRPASFLTHGLRKRSRMRHCRE